MVKRYALVQYPHEEYMHEACMEESPSGTYVHHDDYAALQAENERLKADRVDLEQFREAVESWKYRSECDMRMGYDVVGFEFLVRAKATVLECSRLLALIDAHKGK